MNTKVCRADGGLGCIRGFIREKCQRCFMGSVACEMCHSPPTPYFQNHKRQRLSSTSTLSPASVSASCSTTPSVTSSPGSSLSPDQSSILDESGSGVDASTSASQLTASTASTASVSYHDPLPVHHRCVKPSQYLPASTKSSTVVSKGPSLSIITLPATLTQYATAKQKSISAPSSPMLSISNGGPTIIPYCNFCTEGRKACEECFGLGYVQRVCQSCLRDQHRRHARSRPSLPIAAMNHVGTKIKEHLFHHPPTSSASHGHDHGMALTLRRRNTTSTSNSTTSSKTSTPDKRTRKQQQQQYEKQEQERMAKSMISLPITSRVSPTATMSAESSFKSPTLGPVSEELMQHEKTMEGGGNRVLEVKLEQELELDLGLALNCTSSQIDDGNTSPHTGTKKSLKAAVLNALRLSTSLLHRSNNNSDNDRKENHAGNHRNRHPHRRQWSLATCSLNVPSASTAA